MSEKDFVVEFPDMDTCIIRKASDFDWGDVFRAVFAEHRKKVKRAFGKVLQENRFKGKDGSVFILFPNKYKKFSTDYSYYGWYIDQNGVQHNIIVHDYKDKKGNPCLKGSIDYEYEKNKVYPRKVSGTFVKPKKELKSKSKKPVIIPPMYKDLGARYGTTPHKKEGDNPLDRLPL